MCCNKKGKCIEPKYCYSDLRQNNELISTPSTSKLQPAVNSTSVPYFYDKGDSNVPCFIYTDIGSENDDGSYVVGKDARYVEPVVFKEEGITLILENYKFAYGNRMSDAEDNPYSIQTISEEEQGTDGGSNGGGGAEIASSRSYDDVSSEAMMAPDFGYYYGGYYYGGY